ncbi:MAG: glucosamine 6-phosphate synthetase [Armatimonadota bacterium]
MCGQAGIIFGAKKRNQKEMDYFRKLFSYLLLRSEARGPHATGAAWLNRAGEHNIFKQPVRAREFVDDDAFTDLLKSVNSNTTWLAGHTRWQTRGDARNNANNHPIRAGTVIGTHNGTITNADLLFSRLKLPRFAEVDSELIFRMADNSLAGGRIDKEPLAKRLALCKGEMTAVIVSKLDPEVIVLIKGNKPLELRYHKGFNVIVYASCADYLESVLAPANGWGNVPVKEMEMAAFHCSDLMSYSVTPFRLAGTSKHSSFRRFIIPDEKER